VKEGEAGRWVGREKPCLIFNEYLSGRRVQLIWGTRWAEGRVRGRDEGGGWAVIDRLRRGVRSSRE